VIRQRAQRVHAVAGDFLGEDVAALVVAGDGDQPGARNAGLLEVEEESGLFAGAVADVSTKHTLNERRAREARSSNAVNLR